MDIVLWIRVLWVSIVAGVPIMLVWGWVRWAKRQQPRTLSAAFSLAAFLLATSSALLALAAMIYAQAFGGFPFYDPRLLRIYKWGLLLSLAGTVVAIAGLWKPSVLRWHAPVCALGTLLFWFLTASSE
jgi:hypothetical protein